MDPFTAIALAMMAITAAVGSMSARQAGRAQQKALDHQAELNRQQAERERAIAALEEDRQRDEDNAVMARMRAVAAANGGDISSGSALLIQKQAGREANFNQQMIRAGGDARAHTLETEAGLLRFRGGNARRAGNFRAGMTLLKTGTNVATFGAQGGFGS